MFPPGDNDQDICCSIRGATAVRDGSVVRAMVMAARRGGDSTHQSIRDLGPRRGSLQAAVGLNDARVSGMPCADRPFRPPLPRPWPPEDTFACCVPGRITSERLLKTLPDAHLARLLKRVPSTRARSPASSHGSCPEIPTIDGCAEVATDDASYSQPKNAREGRRSIDAKTSQHRLLVSWTCCPRWCSGGVCALRRRGCFWVFTPWSRPSDLPRRSALLRPWAE